MIIDRITSGGTEGTDIMMIYIFQTPCAKRRLREVSTSKAAPAVGSNNYVRGLHQLPPARPAA